MNESGGFDLVTMGRSSIDLYSNDIGAKFTDIKSFGAFVGGCPTNIAVATTRLGLRTALLTAVGQDPVGEFVTAFLRREGVITDFIPVKAGRRTSAVLLGIEPPDRFPLVFYRDNCADIALTEEDAARIPWAKTKAFLFTGTGLSKEPSLAATMKAIDLARGAGARVYCDIDFRADQWADPRQFSETVQRAAKHAHVIIGTEEEYKAAFLEDSLKIEIKDSQISCPKIDGDINEAIRRAQALGVEAVVLKRGPQGGIVYRPGEPPLEVKPFKVEVLNVLGAGDAFAGGLIAGLSKGYDWPKALRLANACGAILVTKHGCANFMPTVTEAHAFVDSQGGF